MSAFRYSQQVKVIFFKFKTSQAKLGSFIYNGWFHKIIKFPETFCLILLELLNDFFLSLLDVKKIHKG